MPERKIGDFFIELFENPELQTVVNRHWDEIAAEWGLDDEQRQILLAGDAAEIRQRIIEEYAQAAPAALIQPPIVWGITFQFHWLSQGTTPHP